MLFFNAIIKMGRHCEEEKCKRGHRGCRGHTGPQGPLGPQGPQGANGNNGLNGLNGEDGLPGPQGPAGAQGFQGAGGDGAQGAQGAQGFQGFQGADGADGAQGAQGFQGFQGADGAAANTGATGDVGPQGFQGDTGATGPQGDPGTAANTGATGPSGAALIPAYTYRSYEGGPTGIADGEDIEFTSGGITVNISAAAPTTTATVLVDGVYEITFGVLASQPNQFSIHTDAFGGLDLQSYSIVSDETVQNNGSFLFPAFAGTSFSLRNTTGATVVIGTDTTFTNPTTSAYFQLIKIADLP